VAVNRKFAAVIAEKYRPGDISMLCSFSFHSTLFCLWFMYFLGIVWVNDYHLMLVPAMVRQLVPQAVIGFFLHIPFPSSEIFRCLHGWYPPFQRLLLIFGNLFFWQFENRSSKACLDPI
jgi:trehalose 6-phosphate synthase complex regulatory subunit